MSELKDFKAGPLDFYRKKATFDWKKLKVFLETEEIVRYQNELYEELQKYPDYNQQEIITPSFDEQRRLAVRQTFVHKSIELLALSYTLQNLRRPLAATKIMMQFATSSSIKFSVTDSLFNNVIRSMGTSRHDHFLNESESGNIIGCYCLTEIGHGSNARGMQTTATYDKEKKAFILNSANFQAAKCWAGGLGQMATHGVVYAQLILNGEKLGLHVFVVPIRDPKTLLAYPGLIVGDLGEKLGLNGIDNGFLMFNNYEIPRENLLNKVGDVTEDGRYITPYKDANKRHGAALGALSAGRVEITAICETLGFKALTIAIRYAAVRKQFGPEDGPEISILEYQSHQYRLLPYLAAAYTLKVFTTMLSLNFYEFSIDSLFNPEKEYLGDLGIEMHGVSSASKPISGWIMKEAIQECREACGGHGYLKAAGIGDIRNDHDANLTYEGENHVLIQQTCNWLLKLWPQVLRREKIFYPMGSVNFFTNGLDILNNTRFTARSVNEMCEPKNIISIYQWLVCYHLQRYHNKIEQAQKAGRDLFTAKNDAQVFYGKNLGIAFIQHFMLQTMLDKIAESTDPQIRTALLRLFALFGLWSLEKQLQFLYQGGLAVGSAPTSLVHDSILELCADLKNDAVALIDAVAPPDFILNSVLGASDGEVYKHLQAAVFRNPYSMSRPSWWQDITNWKQNVIKSKL